MNPQLIVNQQKTQQVQMLSNYQQDLNKQTVIQPSVQLQQQQLQQQQLQQQQILQQQQHQLQQKNLQNILQQPPQQQPAQIIQKPNEAQFLAQQPIKHVIPAQQAVVQTQLPVQIPQPINKFQTLAQNIDSCNNGSPFLKNNVRSLIDNVQTALHGPPIK